MILCQWNSDTGKNNSSPPCTREATQKMYVGAEWVGILCDDHLKDAVQRALDAGIKFVVTKPMEDADYLKLEEARKKEKEEGPARP
jgi:hypothetical protein